jgi:hypothetical protein
VITAQQCRAFAANCVTLGADTHISMQRATILLAMSRSWTNLANQIDRYEPTMKEEGVTAHSIAGDFPVF